MVLLIVLRYNGKEVYSFAGAIVLIDTDARDRTLWGSCTILHCFNGLNGCLDITRLNGVNRLRRLDGAHGFNAMPWL